MSVGDFKYFAIFGAMRTGSNLLERNLDQFDQITCHGELFNPSFIGKAGQEEYLGLDLTEREDNPQKLIKKMINQSGDALPGFRIFQGHDPRVFRACLGDPKCAKIVLRRRPLDSFVSLQIALKTDQWILGNAPKRRTATITYDGLEYRDYLARLAEYEAELRHGLQEAGQTAFELRYEDLKSPGAMNGVAKYLGISGRINSFEEKIKRQNPEPLSEKVANFEEMMADLGHMGVETIQSSTAPETTRGSGVRDIVVCNKSPVLFAPVAGVDAGPALDAMGQFDGSVTGSLRTGMNQKELGNWLESASGLISFSVVDHPLERAYRGFMRHIFPPEGATFPKIRRRLKRQFELRLPDELTGWSVEDHASAFEAFMVFLKSNLAGQTSIRIDPSWEAQHKLLAGISSVQPIGRIIRGQDFSNEVKEIAKALGKERPTLSDTELEGFLLSDIYARRLENLARAAYAKDYRMFGFSDWGT